MPRRIAVNSLFRFGTEPPTRPEQRIAQLPARPLQAAGSALGHAPGRDTLNLVTTRLGFEVLEAEWNALFDRSGSGGQMFQTFNWLWHWTQHFLPQNTRSLAIVTVRRDGVLIAVLPFCQVSAGGLQQLVFMGAPVSQYGDVLVDQIGDRVDTLERAIRFAVAETRAAVVRLAKVRDDAAIAPVLERFKTEMTGFEEAPFANLTAAATHETYNARFGAKCLRNRRRQARRLEDHGAVALDWTLQGSAAADAARTAMAMKRGWLKVRGQLSRAFADTRSDEFFASVCSGEQRPAGAHVSLLTAGGGIANAAITVTVKGRQAIHVLAYGLTFEKCAAGVLHVERLVEQAFATGVATLDFLAPRHDYKLEWSDGSVRVADYAIPVTYAGKVFTHLYLKYARERIKAAIKAAVKAAPRTLVGPIALFQSTAKFVRR